MIEKLEAFIAARRGWLTNTLDNCGADTPERIISLALTSGFMRETTAEIRVAEKLIMYLRDGDELDGGLIILAAQSIQHEALSASDLLKACSAIFYSTKEA